jgi:hypothetical protein
MDIVGKAGPWIWRFFFSTGSKDLPEENPAVPEKKWDWGIIYPMGN